MTTEIQLCAPDDLSAKVTINATLGELRALAKQMDTAERAYSYPIADLLTGIKSAIRNADKTFTQELPKL